MASPIDLLQEIMPVMIPNTLLYMEAPHEQPMRENPNNYYLAQLKHFWHEHINFYTETGLRCLCARAGPRVLDVHYQRFNNGVRSGEVMTVLAQRDPTIDFIEN